MDNNTITLRFIEEKHGNLHFDAEPILTITGGRVPKEITIKRCEVG